MNLCMLIYLILFVSGEMLMEGDWKGMEKKIIGLSIQIVYKSKSGNVIQIMEQRWLSSMSYKP